MEADDVRMSHTGTEDHAREHHHHDHEHHHEEPMTPDEAVRSLLLLGEVALNAHDYESAVEAYASVLKLQQNEVALYNLGSFYARGLGVRRDYVQAARLFHQAQLLGNERAGKLCGKCMYDYVHDGLDGKTPAAVYAEMAVFVQVVYPEATDKKQEVSRGLLAIAQTCLSKGERENATRVFRAATEYASNE